MSPVGLSESTGIDSPPHSQIHPGHDSRISSMRASLHDGERMALRSSDRCG